MFGRKLAVTIVIVVAVAISGVALAEETVRTDGVKPAWQNALATAAIATRPDDRATHGQGRIAQEQASVVVHPDNRATHGPGAVTIWQSNDVVRPDDRAAHGPGVIGSSQQRVAANATPVWAKALAIRSEALNRKYHLGGFERRATANATPVWAKALAIRSEALNRRYHLGEHAGK
jgi:hypothetical protein